jgi:RND family efflux transporter MFP subunit
MEIEKKTKPRQYILIRIIICLAVILTGVYGMKMLSKLKKPPAETQVKEQPLRVETLTAVKQDAPVVISGYGEMRVLNTFAISPEVAGKIVAVHPLLEVGETIPAEEPLFKIDTRDYSAYHKEALASAERAEIAIQRLEKQYEIDKQRIKTLKRNRRLAEREFKRLRKLLDENQIGTRSRVDAAEQALNSAIDRYDLMAQTLALSPILISEARSSLAAARAQLEIAQIRLQRCEVRAPFHGRVKAVTLETGQYVTPGQNVITLADDALLEIHVSLDSRDARKWLRFVDNPSLAKTAWFARPEPVVCKIRWTEDRKGHFWEGRLNRVVKFDKQTRMLTVAVRAETADTLVDDSRKLPLAEGMFCIVEIPGRTLRNVVAVPQQAVSFKNTVYLVTDNHLKTQPVKVAHKADNQAYISAGLNAGDIVITTRLTDPLENALVEINHE